MDSLVGILARDWWTLLKENHFAIDPPYWPKGLFLIVKSIFNSKLAKKEERAFGEKIENTEIEKSPVFIVGHWRSGTTLLHNYLALDERFAYPTTLDARHPYTFLTLQSIIDGKGVNYKAQKRRMDNMYVTLYSPAEDEFALAIMSLKSPLLGWAFPRKEQTYDRYLTFRGVTPHEIDVWKNTANLFFKKLTVKYNARQLLLKSPTHTGRIRILREMFPDSKFIHIHRNPYRVFQSTVRLYQTAIKASRLQLPLHRNGVERKIINQYLELYEAFCRDKELLSSDQFVEIAFEEMEENPIKVIKNIYDHFGWNEFDKVQRKIEKYIELNKNYKKNVYRPLPTDKKMILDQAWKKYFEIWQYRN